MITLAIDGMTCQHCVKAVTTALAAVPEVEDVVVDLDAGEARVRGDADPEALVAAVEEEGYDATVRDG